MPVHESYGPMGYNPLKKCVAVGATGANPLGPDFCFSKRHLLKTNCCDINEQSTETMGTHLSLIFRGVSTHISRDFETFIDSWALGVQQNLGFF